ncbi:helix-turn-helix domain-containing protein [Micromonospora siamensis]|uniref:Helix-turn-helix domain-containing protein n=1 Tax=Micromonospora siamensis TaxID=299152 RepID=A0A1C5H1E7_9ACTN|nr:AraC family transcriptional regulator [Micromonospora siamensis]SCG39882.1 Helix-turn-helix domain-containing protein [Micromonospora siamensis]
MRQRARGDDRGILDPRRLRRQVRFRRRLPAPALRPYVEHYWLIDWTLPEPYEQRLVPHPAVNVVLHGNDDGPETAELAGVDTRLFSITLHGTGRASGAQFRPGGFRPFWRRPVAELTGRRQPLAGLGLPIPAGRLGVGTDDERCRRLDALLTGWSPEPDPVTTEVVALAEEIRVDRGVLRVDDFARRHGLTTRRLQRLFLDHVGIGPKWVIRRYRLQEAIERAAGGPLDWAALAADLGYADQAHLVREFSAVTGVSPAAYARSLG